MSREGVEKFANRCWNAHLGTMLIEDRVSKYVEEQLGWTKVSVKKEMCE